jgi:hypothetical protein
VRPDDPETKTMPTNLSKNEFATILSALDGQPRNPANRDKALTAIGGRAAKLGLTTDEILDAAPGLLDGRLSAEDWLAEITDAGQSKVEKVTAEVVAAVKAGSAERAAAAESAARPLPKLTRGERQLVVNIARNLMTPVNGAEPRTLDEAGSVWRDCLDQGPEIIKPTSLPGLVASLTKKGLATTNDDEHYATLVIRAEHPLDIREHRGVAAEHAMVAEQPEVAGLRDRLDWRLCATWSALCVRGLRSYGRSRSSGQSSSRSARAVREVDATTIGRPRVRTCELRTWVRTWAPGAHPRCAGPETKKAARLAAFGRWVRTWSANCEPGFPDCP